MPRAIMDLKARYNASGNAIIPNTFQHPNIFIDRLMYYLTPVENTILTFAVRRILGFHTNIMSRKDNISLSQFTDGIISEDGRVLSMGCGVGSNAVRGALESLAAFKVLLPTTEKADPKKGQEYWLQNNENSIDWDGLEKRRAKKKFVEYRRTKKARSVVAQHTLKDRGSVVGQQAKGIVGQDPRVLSDNNTKPTETHRNPPARAAGISREWDMLHGQDVQATDEEAEFMNLAVDSANQIATGKPARYKFALQFIIGVHKIPTASQVKNWRKGIDEWLSFKPKQPTPDQVTQAILEYQGRNLTIATPYSLSNLYAFANPANGHTPEPDPQDQDWRKQEWRKQTVK